jgi:hypothetical protein
MNYYEGDNIGSIKAVEIIRHDLPIGFNPVYLPIGSTWTLIPFREENGELVLKTEESDNGPIYTYSGSFFVHNMRDEVDQVMIPFCGKAIAILRIMDMNDRVYIIGTPDAPVTINANGSTGKKYTNENGITFNFTVDQTTEALRA